MSLHQYRYSYRTVACFLHVTDENAYVVIWEINEF